MCERRRKLYKQCGNITEKNNVRLCKSLEEKEREREKKKRPRDWGKYLLVVCLVVVLITTLKIGRAHTHA